MSDEIGQRIQQSVCADCWNDWLRNYSIKVINELRLDLSRDEDSALYDKHMREFLGIDEELYAKLQSGQPTSPSP